MGHCGSKTAPPEESPSLWTPPFIPPEPTDLLYLQIKERLRQVPYPNDEWIYPAAPLKKWNTEETTWGQLSHPQEYTRLLRTTLQVKLPDNTKLCTIEYLADRDENFAHQVLTELGLQELLPAPFDLIVDLVWFFYVAEVNFLGSLEEINYLCHLDGALLFRLISTSRTRPFSHRIPDDRSSLLFIALTGTIFHAQYSTWVNFPPGTFDYNYRRPWWEPGMYIYKNEYHYLGFSIYRLILYVIHGSSLDFSEDMIPSYSFHLTRGSPYDIIRSSERETYLTPLVQAYRREDISLAYLESMPLPKDLIRLIQTYTLEDNVDRLAHLLGMVFPPDLKTSGDRTNYFWGHLSEYEKLCQAREELKISVYSEGMTETQRVLEDQALVPGPGTPLTWETLSQVPDGYILSRALRPITKWRGRQDLFTQYLLGTATEILGLVRYPPGGTIHTHLTLTFAPVPRINLEILPEVSWLAPPYGYIVFNPSYNNIWALPQKISRDRLVPLTKKDRALLSQCGVEVPVGSEELTTKLRYLTW